MGKESYKLTIKEYDGKQAFWTGKMPYLDTVECNLSESNLDVTIEKVVGTYLPIKYVMASDGTRNLTTDRKKRVTLLSPIRALFGPDVKEATLYLHFGSVFDAGFRKCHIFVNVNRNAKFCVFLLDWNLILDHKNDQYFREAMKQLNDSFNAPGFWSSPEGSIGTLVIGYINMCIRYIGILRSTKILVTHPRFSGFSENSDEAIRE